MPKAVHGWVNEEQKGCGAEFEFSVLCPECGESFCSTDSQQVWGSLYILIKESKDQIQILKLQVALLQSQLLELTNRVYSCKNYKDE